LDAETEALVGYATWRHREVHLPWGQEQAISIEWFGVDTAYQGQRTPEDASIATTLFETVEKRAREDEMSAPDMPIFLEVDVDNSQARGFWEYLGFDYIEDVEVLSKGRYRRMLQSASG
jgi:ribosomal protein S18 acetylase RimI-like enzyme